MSAAALPKIPPVTSGAPAPKEGPEYLWFVARGAVLKGPYTTERLEEKMQKREISFLDYCWRQGFNEWRPLASVDAFERRSRLKKIPSYPNVPVPGGSKNASGTVADRRKPSVELRFSRRISGAFSIYEWTYAALFAVALSYVTSTYALYQVKKGYFFKLENSLTGRGIALGTQEANLHPEVWEPLFSAPEYLQSANLLSMPVRIEGIPRNQVGSHAELQNYGVEFAASLRLWSGADYDLDPVLTRPLVVYGNLSPKHPRNVEVYFDGEPYLRPSVPGLAQSPRTP
jgi:hypothetical protein